MDGLGLCIVRNIIDNMNIFMYKIWIITVLCVSVQCYKILVLYPLPIRSVNLLGEGAVKHLLDAGHEVTYATAFPIKDDLGSKFRQIDLSKNKEMLAGDPGLNITHIMIEGQPSDDIWYHQEFARMVANLTFGNEILLNFLRNTNEEFDVFVSDYYETEVYAGLSALYNCPMIWMYSIGVDWIALRLVDEPSNPAYTVDYSSINIVPLSFIQRVQELWTQSRWNFLKRFWLQPSEENMFNSVIKPLIEKRGRNPPLYQDVIYNASLIFGNDYNVARIIPSLPQNYKLIGGQHIEEPAKALPKNLQILMDNSKYGVIYFSMGSTWQSKDIPIELTQDLLKVFGKLKQTVIWKYEEDLQNLPKNVHILKWAPQHSILAHPKCWAFVTHGGQLSSGEAVHFGVPIIGIPISFDQFRNINKAVSMGFAIKLDLNFDLPAKLEAALYDILSNKRYSRRVKELSAIYHDRPVPPGKELVHWVEHVVKTQGALHLRSPALMVPWYQKFYIDLMFVILVLFIVIFKTLKIALNVLRKPTKTKKKTN